MPIQGASRAVAADVQIKLGIANTQGKLFPIRRSESKKATQLTGVCPDCAGEVNQFYRGACGHRADGKAGYTTGQLAKGRKQDDGTYVIIPAAELAALKASDLPEKELDLQLCPANQLEAQTRPGGTCYWFEPTKGDNFYGLLCALLNRDAGLAVWGVLLISGQEKAYRLEPFNGGILLQELIRPQEVCAVEPVPAVFKPSEADMFDRLVQAMTTDFDPESLRSDLAERLAARVAELAGGNVATVTPITASKKAEATEDLTAMLEAALETLQAQKGA